MYAIRARRKTVTEKDFLEAVNKVSTGASGLAAACNALRLTPMTTTCCKQCQR